jgi:hypothetical protein
MAFMGFALALIGYSEISKLKKRLDKIEQAGTPESASK